MLPILVCTRPLPHLVYCFFFPCRFQSSHSNFQLFSDFAPLGFCWCCFPGLPSLVRRLEGRHFQGNGVGWKSTATLADPGAANAVLSVWWHLPMHIFIRWGPGGKTDSPRLPVTYPPVLPHMAIQLGSTTQTQAALCCLHGKLIIWLLSIGHCLKSLSL